MHITLYKGAKNPDPLDVHDFTWDEFCAQLAEVVNTPPDAPETAPAKRQKESLLAFAPHVLHEGQSRSNAAVRAVTALVIDVDRCDSGALCSAIETLGVAAFVYESPSSPNEDGSDRIRVVCPTTRDMTPEECDPLRLVFAEMVGLDPETSGVAGALGPARIFFLGRLHGSPLRDTGKIDGAPLDVDAFLSAAREVATPRSQAPRANVEGAPAAADDEIGALIGAHESYRGRRHDLAGALGGELRKLGVYRGRAEVLGSAWLGEEKWDEHGAWFMGAYGKDAAEVSGRAALAEIVGEERADAFAKAFAPFKGAIVPATATASAASAGDGLSFASDEPLFVIHRGAVWILDDSGGYSPPVAARDLKPALKQKNLLAFFANEKGTIPPTDALYEMGGLVSEFEKDFRVPLTTVRGTDSARLVLVEGHRTRTIAPVYDPEVEAWLSLLFGDGLDDAYVWIAACAQRYIGRPAACLIHIGPPDVGKSLIYSVLSYMWHASGPVDLGSAITRFNGKIARCPIVLDDEARELAREKISTRDFRELVAAPVRDIELKGRECSLLHGCMRYAVTANGVHQLTFTDVDGAATLAALDTRIALHVTPDDAHDAAVTALAKLRADAEIDRADVPRIAGHFAWIQETVAVPTRRFMGGRDGGPSAVLPGHARRFVEIYEKVGTLLAAGPDGAAFVRARDGRLLCSTAKLASLFPYDREALTHVQEALRPLRVDRVKYSPSGKREDTRAFWSVDEERLVSACESA